ncbi:MAG: hypothetical protein BKP49_06770 [Treponema sp. CETP13]|nr:MAG: hypothetical protein BKP49_06770 [Treponema sp. CETP13]
MKKDYIAILIVFTCLTLSLWAQKVVSSGLDFNTATKEELTNVGSTISLSDYENLKNEWNNYFLTITAFDSTLEADISTYQQKLLACLEDESSRGILQPYALGEVIFYKYFALESPLVTARNNTELESEIDNFLLHIVSLDAKSSVKMLQKQNIFCNVFSFLSVSEPNKQMGIASNLKSLINQLSFNDQKTGSAKFDPELEKIIVYHAINRLNTLQFETPERNLWIELVNTPSVWYIFQHCEDFASLREQWNKKGFGQRDLVNLEDGYFSEKSRAIYHIQDLLQEISGKERLLGIPSAEVFPVYSESIIEFVEQDEFILFLCSEDDVKQLDVELNAFNEALNLWASRINTLAITGEASNAEKN